MNTEVNTAIRKAQVEEAFWRFFTVYRLQLQDCEANQRILEAALEDKLLPISFENLTTLWESLTPQEKSAYAPSTTDEVKPRKAATTVVETSAVLEKMGGVLPQEYDRRRILKMGRDEYKELLKKYGQEIVLNRVNGIE